MIKFFLGNNVYGRIVAGILLLSFFMLNISSAGILFSVPIANAEVDAPTPQPALLMRAYEGTGAPPIICTRDSNESFTEYCGELGFASGVSAEVSRTGADVTLGWQLDQNAVWGGWADCALYGSVAARTITPETGSLVLHDPHPGLYVVTCHDAGNFTTASANIQLRIAGSRYPTANQPFFSCSGYEDVYPFETRNYRAGALVPPQPNGDRSSLNDVTDACDATLGGANLTPEWTSGAAPLLADSEVGWPAARSSISRTTTVKYKDAQTVSVCTKIDTTATKYRVGLTWHTEVFNLGEPGDVTVTKLDPFEISRTELAIDPQEKCVDRPLNDDIVSATVPQCGTSTEIEFFSIKYIHNCYTNVIAANGKVAPCHNQETKSVFGGIFSWILLASGPFTAWLGALASVLGTVVQLISTGVGIASSISNYLNHIEKNAVTPILGTVAPPDQNLGECAWPAGIPPPTVGLPACTSGCAFDKESITEGQTVNYPWSFDQNVSRLDFSCTGDLGTWR